MANATIKIIGDVKNGFLLAPVSANIFTCHFEEESVLSNNASPSVWFRYVDSKNTAINFLGWEIKTLSFNTTAAKTTQKRKKMMKK